MEPETPSTEKTCFVIMPISDIEGYAPGHFNRVYEHLIKPACKEAGFIPDRADEALKTNHIIIGILRRIIKADMVLCDLSSKNPNVMYELGIRQAFNLPVTTIKDKRTDRIFDIQGLRDFEYDESLRIDNVEDSIKNLSETIKNTYKPSEGDINSIVQLLGLEAATIKSTEVSAEGSLILEALSDISQRLSDVERDIGVRSSTPIPKKPSGMYSQTVSAEKLKQMSLEAKYVGRKVRHQVLGVGAIQEFIGVDQARVVFNGGYEEILPLAELEDAKNGMQL